MGGNQFLSIFEGGILFIYIYISIYGVLFVVNIFLTMHHACMLVMEFPLLAKANGYIPTLHDVCDECQIVSRVSIRVLSFEPAL